MTVRELLPTLIQSAKISKIVTYISWDFNKGYEITHDIDFGDFDDSMLDAEVKYFRMSDEQKALIVKIEYR